MRWSRCGGLLLVAATLALVGVSSAPLKKEKDCPRRGGYQCNLQGLCFKGTCYCRPGYTGDDCGTGA